MDSSRASCSAGAATARGTMISSRGSRMAAGSRSPGSEGQARALGGRIGAGRIADRAQPAAQAAQPESVGAAERPGKQLGGGLLVQRLGPQRAAQQGQQGPGPRFVGQRQLVPGDGHRDA